VLLYLNERSGHSVSTQVGEHTSLDRIDVVATVQKVDPAARVVLLRVEVTPNGTYAEQSSAVPSKPLVLFTSSPTRAQLTFPAGQLIPAQDVTVGLADGTVSDYPFDRYTASIAFAAESGGVVAPLHVEVDNIDPFFRLSAPKAVVEPDVAGLNERVSRSRGTAFLAVFMMAAMWALALAVVGMRNAAPGNPPVGCLLDYAAFFWAELLVALSVVAVAAWGIVAERVPAPA
jgi:hypothetical protein